MSDGLGYAPLLTASGLVEAYSPERHAASHPFKKQRLYDGCVSAAPLSAFAPVPHVYNFQYPPPPPPPLPPPPLPPPPPTSSYRNYDDIYDAQARRSPKRARVARPSSPTYDPGPVQLVAEPPAYNLGPSVVSHRPAPRACSPTYDPTPDCPPASVWKQPPAVIESVAFRVRSAEEIEKLSAVEVKTSRISDEHGRAVVNGLRDPRFGPCFGTNTPCGLCGATPKRPCTGHAGHFRFAEPLFAVNLIKFVASWLRRVCPSCGHLHVVVDTAEDVERAQQLILNSAQPKEKRCAACGDPLYKSVVWKRELQTLVVKRSNSVEEETLAAKEVFDMFERVPEDHRVFQVKHRGQRITHPKHLISRVISVPSLCLRPCVGDGTGQGARGEADLTYRLKQIIAANELYANKKRQQSDSVSLKSALFGLQDLYTQYLDVSKSLRGGGGQEGRQPKYKSHACMLKGKQGLLRENCMGKRVDHASRCPIAPFEGTGNVGHPSQVGVPDWLCRKHVVPIRVTDYNKKTLRQMIADGKCNFIERGDGERIDLSATSNVGKLEVGKDIVYRQLTDGDVVLFNRQPSLSMRSMQGLKVVRLPPVKEGVGSRVFRLPLSQTTPFNADFDGDEMNLHVPQTPEARAEALELMGAHRNVLSANSGAACIVPVQTARLASFAMTRKGAVMTKREWYSCLGHAPDRVLDRLHAEPTPSFPAPARLFWSLSLPSDYSWSNKGVVIVGGYLQRGRVNKGVLCQLVHDIANDVSPMAALDFIHSLTCLCRGYSSMKEPGTILFDDMSPTQSLVDACKRLTMKERRKASVPGADVAACRERAMRGMMSLVYRDNDENGLSNLIESGAKGSRANKAVMLGFLGPMLSLEDTKRGVFRPPESNPQGEPRCFVTNTAARPFDDGFIDSGYSNGMNLEQYSMHAIAGRRGLTSSSRKVGKIGYMYRRCSVSNDSLIAKHGQVVDTSVDPPQVVSFLYGGDGRSPYVVEKATLQIPAPTSESEWAQTELDADVTELKSLFPDAPDRDFDLPVSIARILFQAEHRAYTAKEQDCAETLRGAWERVKRVAELHGKYYGDYVRLWARIHLHPHRLAKLPPHARAWAVGETDKRLWKARVPDGECLGCHASSSLSAAATQATLNSFHNVGSRGGSYRGLEETVNLVKHRSQKVTRFRLHFDPSTSADDRRAETARWAKQHRLITLRDVVLKREPPVCQTQDNEVLKAYWAFPDEPTRFQPKMRLEVQCDLALVFSVRLALLRCGVRHASYALRETDNTWVFHLSSILTSNHLSQRVTGSIPGCRAEGDVVLCDSADQESLVEHIQLESFWTNCFHETKARLGVEAARRLIVVEMQTMLESFGCKMSPRHIELIADRCCQTGALLGMTRFGVRSRNSDRVFHATFEMPVIVLSEGAVAGKIDRLNGSQERQIVGATNKTGSHHQWMDVLPDQSNSASEFIPVPESDSESDVGVDDDSWLHEWIQKQNASA